MLVFDKYYKDISQLKVNGSPIHEWIKYNINNGFNVRVDAIHKSKADKKLVSCIWLKVAPEEVNDEFFEKLQTLSNLANKPFTFIYTHPEKNIIQPYSPQEVYERLMEKRL